MATLSPQLDNTWRCLLLLLDHQEGQCRICTSLPAADWYTRVRVHVTLPQVSMWTLAASATADCEHEDRSSPVHKPATTAGGESDWQVVAASHNILTQRRRRG